MKHSQKANVILGACMVLVGVFSVYILYKSLIPSDHGLPFEQIDLEQADEYMAYEEGYIVIDAGSEEEYNAGHLEDALNIPLKELPHVAEEMLPDQLQMIYIYAHDRKTSYKAAMTLWNLGYMNITEIRMEETYFAVTIHGGLAVNSNGAPVN